MSHGDMFNSVTYIGATIFCSRWEWSPETHLVQACKIVVYFKTWVRYCKNVKLQLDSIRIMGNSLDKLRYIRSVAYSSHMTSWPKKLLACVTSWPVPMSGVRTLRT